MTTAHTIEGGKEGEAEEDEGAFNLQKHLENYKFEEYSKIETALRSQELTLEDILECNEKELKDTLEEYGVKAVQRNRFVKAIKALPDSKMYLAHGNSGSYGVHNALLQLSEAEQLAIDQVNEASKSLASRISTLRLNHKNHQTTIRAAKAKVTFYHYF